MKKMNQKLIEIRDRLNLILAEQKKALVDKNVTLPSEVSLDNIPLYIRAIDSGDINFFIDFALIDQVGTPHAPLVGQSTGGFDYEFGIEIDTDTTKFVTMDFTTVFTELNAGKRGQVAGGMIIALQLDTNNDGIMSFDFNKLEQVPEVLNYVDQVY